MSIRLEVACLVAEIQAKEGLSYIDQRLYNTELIIHEQSTTVYPSKLAIVGCGTSKYYSFN